MHQGSRVFRKRQQHSTRTDSSIDPLVTSMPQAWRVADNDDDASGGLDDFRAFVKHEESI